MAQTGETLAPLTVIGDAVKRQLFSLQDYSLLAMSSITNVFTPPYYWADVLEQMDFIGIGSLPIVLIIGFFIGAVLLLQTAAQFERFGGTALTGDAVSLALVRELGPTITAIVIAGRRSEERRCRERVWIAAAGGS